MSSNIDDDEDISPVVQLCNTHGGVGDCFHFCALWVLAQLKVLANPTRAQPPVLSIDLVHMEPPAHEELGIELQHTLRRLRHSALRDTATPCSAADVWRAAKTQSAQGSR